MKSTLLAIFDQAEYLNIELPFPDYLNRFLCYERDFQGALYFLHAYKDVSMTYTAYRREIERFLHWSWQIAKKSIFELKRADIEDYIKFCQNPRKSWIALQKFPRFVTRLKKRVPNKNWRPFVATISKTEMKNGKTPTVDNYQLSQKALQAIFAILSSFYNFLIQEGLTEINPVLQIRQKSKYIRRQQSKPKIRRLSKLQWSYVIDTVKNLAKENPEKHARTLFIMTALYSMYLRISELVENERWSPKMNDFKRDSDGNWWFSTVGKGNKERQIAVSDTMLESLKSWRKHLNLHPLLPNPDDDAPLIPKLIGKGNISNTSSVRKIVQNCFDLSIEKMKQEGFSEEAGELQSATVHWLRHTGISEDVKRRPREHVRDDAGHTSMQTTDKYIDSDSRERHRSAKGKLLEEDKI